MCVWGTPTRPHTLSLSHTHALAYLEIAESEVKDNLSHALSALARGICSAVSRLQAKRKRGREGGGRSITRRNQLTRNRTEYAMMYLPCIIAASSFARLSFATSILHIFFTSETAEPILEPCSPTSVCLSTSPQRPLSPQATEVSPLSRSRSHGASCGAATRWDGTSLEITAPLRSSACHSSARP